MLQIVRAMSLCMALPLAPAVATGEPDSIPAPSGDHSMHHAHGTFDVKVRPLAEDQAEGGTLSRYALDKQYHGPLTANGDGEMLAAGTAVEGAAGYVAVERVVGALAGRAGSFVLLHRGTMNARGQRLDIEVLPESGTGELVGISGTLTIEVVDRVHHYDLAYELPPAP